MSAKIETTLTVPELDNNVLLAPKSLKERGEHSWFTDFNHSIPGEGDVFRCLKTLIREAQTESAGTCTGPEDFQERR